MSSYNLVERFIYEGILFFSIENTILPTVDSLSTPSFCEDIQSESDFTPSEPDTGNLQTKNKKFNSSQYFLK